MVAFAPSSILWPSTRSAPAVSLFRCGGSVERTPVQPVGLSRRGEGEAHVKLHPRQTDGKAPINRRSIWKLAVVLGLASSFSGPSSPPAHAEQTKVWGAAELDFRMYICGATGKGCPAKLETIIPPARSMDIKLSQALSKITVAALAAMGENSDAVQAETDKTRRQFEKEFQKRVPFPPGDLSNQYTFDFETYVGWRAANQFLPSQEKRQQFSEEVGKQVIKVVEELGTTLSVVDSRTSGLDDPLKSCRNLLAAFEKAGMSGKWQFDSDDYNRKYWSSDGPPTSLTMTVDLPSFLQSSLQLSAEGVGLSPNFLALALKSYMNSCNVNADYNEFFVDEKYRPNPDDYAPNQLVVQFNVRPKP